MTGPSVLVGTAGLTREEWLAWRREGLGASDAAAVLDADPWRTKWQLYLDKRGELPPDDPEGNEAMLWGQILEDAVAREYARRTNARVERRNAILAHPDHAWMLANPDRLIGADAAPDGHTGQGLLEIKTANQFKADEWRDGEAPLAYLLQWHHAAAVTGTTWGALACLVGGQRLVVRELTRDDELVAHLIDAEARFWTDHVQAGVPPPVDGAASTEELIKRLYAESDPDAAVELDDDAAVELDDDAAAAIQLYCDARDREKRAEADKREAGNALRVALGDAEAGYLPDQDPQVDKPAVTWRTSLVTKLDQKTLKAEQPEVAEKYTTTEAQRRINVRTPE